MTPGASPDEKACYTHAFVVLAASSARVAELPGADDLLEEALTVWESRFFDPAYGMFVDAWDRGFARLDPYRGVNSNMHAVEALLAAADATGDVGAAGAGARDRPPGRPGLRAAAALADPGALRPALAAAAGAQPRPAGRPVPAVRRNGRAWPRVVPTAAASRGGSGRRPPRTGCSSPRSPCSTGRRPTGGRSTGPTASSTPPTGTAARSSATGCTGWSPRVLPRPRRCTPGLASGGTRSAPETWWAYAERYLIDRERGSWHHQLDPDNRPIATVWPGKPDLYHAVQATLLPRLPLALSLAAALAAGPPAATPV